MYPLTGPGGDTASARPACFRIVQLLRMLFTSAWLACACIANAQLINGGSITGTIAAAGQIDSYFFDGDAGETVRIRVGDTGATSLFPRVELFNAANVSQSFGDGSNAAWISFTLTADDTYEVQVSDGSAGGNNTGDYVLHFAQMPGANEFGVLPANTVTLNSVSLADVDTYTFEANAGADIEVTVIDLNSTSLFARVDLFGPDGTWLGQGDGPVTAVLNEVLSTSGTYTLAVYDGTSGGANTGDYSIELTGTGIVNVSSVRVPLPLGAVIALAVLLALVGLRRSGR